MKRQNESQEPNKKTKFNPLDISKCGTLMCEYKFMEYSDWSEKDIEEEMVNTYHIDLKSDEWGVFKEITKWFPKVMGRDDEYGYKIDASDPVCVPSYISDDDDEKKVNQAFLVLVDLQSFDGYYPPDFYYALWITLCAYDVGVPDSIKIV